jgi:hypothetical protein
VAFGVAGGHMPRALTYYDDKFCFVVDLLGHVWAVTDRISRTGDRVRGFGEEDGSCWRGDAGLAGVSGVVESDAEDLGGAAYRCEDSDCLSGDARPSGGKVQTLGERLAKDVGCRVILLGGQRDGDAII